MLPLFAFHLRTNLLKMHAQSCVLLIQDLRKNFNACFYYEHELYDLIKEAGLYQFKN